MKLNMKTDYALRVLIFLGGRPDQLFDIETLSRTYDLPASSLMKIVSELVHHGFVRSIRGRLGGIQIGMPPSEIRVSDVVLAMGEPMKIVDCSSCLLAGNCRLQGVLCEAAEAFMAVLTRYTLDELVAKPAPVLSAAWDAND